MILRMDVTKVKTNPTKFNVKTIVGALVLLSVNITIAYFISGEKSPISIFLYTGGVYLSELVLIFFVMMISSASADFWFLAYFGGDFLIFFGQMIGAMIGAIFGAISEGFS